MRYHRNIKMLRGQLDAAPFVMVFFLVLIFVLLGNLVYTPGVQVRLPVTDNLPGLDNPSVSVAVDPQGRFYFENQLMSELELRQRLEALAGSTPGLILIVHADRDVSYDTLVQLTQLARKSGIEEALLATMPRLFSKEHTPTESPR
ncbi:MAG: biopolymer transporter ExbD [Verrucomicrobia bacterium]|jgi:biopolymer transport protein ExbD|nr:biopolymer transporter ExbD [Verrucomicrobiota bacterium]